MASTCSAVRVMPASSETRTDAEGWSELDEKRDSWGITTFTTAELTPFMDSMVWSSSSATACWYSTCCWNCEVVTPELSSRL